MSEAGSVRRRGVQRVDALIRLGAGVKLPRRRIQPLGQPAFFQTGNEITQSRIRDPGSQTDLLIPVAWFRIPLNGASL